MYRQNILILLLIELVLLTGSVVARYVGQTLDYTLLPSFAIILQMIFVVTIILIPLIYLYIIPNLDDKKFQIARISTYTLLVIVNLGILTLFLLNVLSFFGIVSFPFQ